MEMLDVLLQQCHINVNCQDNEGRTPLMKSVNTYQTDSFIMRLLEANCDPNIGDKYKETPLYAAVTRPTITIAHELIKRGSDINARTKDLRTPLHQAVDYNNLEAVSLLLFYGADVNVLSRNNTTAFMNALSYGDLEASEMLINYYDSDECLRNIAQGYTSLYFAMQRRSPLAVRLVEMGADVNYVTPHGENLLVFSLFYGDATLFKLMWNGFNYEIILSSSRPFLLTYIKNCCFATHEWVEGLRLILESHVAIELVKCHHDYIKQKGIEECGIFQELMKAFYRKNVKFSDRLTIISLALSLRAEVNIHDVRIAYEFYGFNEELEVFIYFNNYDNIIDQYRDFKFLLLPFILALEDNFDLKTAKLVYHIHNYMSTCVESQADTEHNWLGFFMRPCYLKFLKIFPAWWTSQHPEIEEKLQNVPEFPSLLELSRNQARKFIRQNYKIKKPYHFHDVVKRLSLPQRIKDIIRFKVPVYK